MRKIRTLSFALIACTVLFSQVANAQTQRENPYCGFWTFVEGLGGGAGLALAYIAPQGEGWLVSDESALPLFTVGGVAAAFVARGLSSRLDPDDPHRPQFRLAAGRSDKTELDYSLAVRAPLSSRFDIQAAVFLASNDWERTAIEERCDIFLGCFTGNYIVDAKYQQSISAIVSGVYAVRTTSRFNTTIAFGAGPAMTKVENHEEVRTTRAGAIAELLLGVDYGKRNRWTLEAGTRVITGTSHNTPVVQFRLGRAFGY